MKQISTREKRRSGKIVGRLSTLGDVTKTRG